MKAVKDTRKGNIYFIHNEFLRGGWGRAIGPIGIAVYNALAVHANVDTGECWPAYATIAELCGISRRQAIREVNKLVLLNIVAKDLPDNYSTATFTLLDPKVWRSPETALDGAADYLEGTQDDIMSLATPAPAQVGGDTQSPGGDCQSLGGDTQSLGGDTQSLGGVTGSHPNNTHKNNTHLTTFNPVPKPTKAPPRSRAPMRVAGRASATFNESSIEAFHKNSLAQDEKAKRYLSAFLAGKASIMNPDKPAPVAGPKFVTENRGHVVGIDEAVIPVEMYQQAVAYFTATKGGMYVTPNSVSKWLDDWVASGSPRVRNRGNEPRFEPKKPNGGLSILAAAMNGKDAVARSAWDG